MTNLSWTSKLRGWALDEPRGIGRTGHHGSAEITPSAHFCTKSLPGPTLTISCNVFKTDSLMLRLGLFQVKPLPSWARRRRMGPWEECRQNQSMACKGGGPRGISPPARCLQSEDRRRQVSLVTRCLGSCSKRSSFARRPQKRKKQKKAR